MSSKKYKYDVALSFANEDRNYVKRIAENLKLSGIKVFYDEYETSELWGKNLYEHLDDVYQKKAKYVLMFISKNYKKKLWTNHERRSAQARAFKENDEYILPIKLDDTEIPGILSTIGYLDGSKKTPKEISDLTVEKLEVQKAITNTLELKDKEDETIYIPKVRRTISDLEKKKFLRSSFSEIKSFFNNALTKLKSSNAHIETELEEITSIKFVASAYVEGELTAQCKIWVGGMFGEETSISFAEGTRSLDINNDNSLNDSARVVDDGIEIFFDILGMSFGHIEGVENIDLKHASAKDVARYYWARFTNYLRF